MSNEEPMTEEQLDNALELLMAVLRPPTLGPHTHKCGFDKNDHRGCGYEWTHDGNDTQRAAQEVFDKTRDREAANRKYADLHACPQCGRGPWRLHVTPETKRALEEQTVKINLETGDTTELA